MTTNTMAVVTLGLRCLFPVWVMLFAKVSCSSLTFGKEADEVCQAYKRVCPRHKVCAMQTIQWPRVSSFPVCVHKDHIHVRSRECEQAPSPGGCSKRRQRWYYNMHVAACSWFTYGGCGGNANNFHSRVECERTCITGQQKEDDASGAANDVKADAQTHPRHHHHRRQPPNQHTSQRQHVFDSSLLEKTGKPSNRYSHRDFRYRMKQEGIRNSKPYFGSSNAASKPKLNLDVFSTTKPTTTTIIIRSWRVDNDNIDDNRSDNDKWKSDNGRLAADRMHSTPEYHNDNASHKTQYYHYNRQYRHSHRPFKARQSRLLDRRTNSTYDDRSSPDITQPLTNFANINRNVRKSSERRFAYFSRSNRRPEGASDVRRDGKPQNRLADRAVLPQKLSSFNPQDAENITKPLESLRLINNRLRLSRTSTTVSKKSDAFAKVTSPPLKSSYAAVAEESVRTFPKRQQRKRSKGNKQRNRRRRRHRRRRKKGKRGNKRRKEKKKKKTESVAPQNASMIITKLNDMYNFSSKSSDYQTMKELPDQFSELHQKNAKLRPELGKSKTSVRKGKINIQNEPDKDQKKTKRRKRRRRRKKRKGKGKRKERRRGRGRDETGPTKEEVPPANNQYYEKIQLFSILEKKTNETEAVE